MSGSGSGTRKQVRDEEPRYQLVPGQVECTLHLFTIGRFAVGEARFKRSGAKSIPTNGALYVTFRVMWRRTWRLFERGISEVEA